MFKFIKIIRYLNKKSRWILPLYFQVIHALGLLVASLFIFLGTNILFPTLKEGYKITIFFLMWGVLILFSSYVGDKTWRKGMLICSLILILGYLINLLIK